jgi:hypothetical protein
MTTFDIFFRFFGPQTVFISGWGTEFKKIRFFEFFVPQTVKNGQICIQTIK